jgi:hypothetical protein
MQASLTFIKIDVSALVPPEPMAEILKHLATLTTQECLLVKHRRQPFPLYEKLNKAGFSYHCEVHTEDDVTLYIFLQNIQGVFDEWLITNGIKISLLKGND